MQYFEYLDSLCVVVVVVLGVGVDLAGVPPLDRDPDRSKLSRKLRARRASL